LFLQKSEKRECGEIATLLLEEVNPGQIKTATEVYSYNSLPMTTLSTSKNILTFTKSSPSEELEADDCGLSVVEAIKVAD